MAAHGMHIRRNDMVVARTGRAAGSGKPGKVLHVIPAKRQAVVEGLNFIHKTLRKSQDTPEGGIIRKEGPLAVSVLALYCPQCKKGVRVGRARSDKGVVRTCKRCGHQFDG